MIKLGLRDSSVVREKEDLILLDILEKYEYVLFNKEAVYYSARKDGKYMTVSTGS